MTNENVTTSSLSDAVSAHHKAIDALVGFAESHPEDQNLWATLTVLSDNLLSSFEAVYREGVEELLDDEYNRRRSPTPTPSVDLMDALSDINTRIEYAHALAGLIQEQRDFARLPPHQQYAITALGDFTHEAICAVSNLMHKN